MVLVVSLSTIMVITVLLSFSRTDLRECDKLCILVFDLVVCTIMVITALLSFSRTELKQGLWKPNSALIDVKI